MAQDLPLGVCVILLDKPFKMIMWVLNQAGVSQVFLKFLLCLQCLSSFLFFCFPVLMSSARHSVFGCMVIVLSFTVACLYRICHEGLCYTARQALQDDHVGLESGWC